jgi:hypothetical protein
MRQLFRFVETGKLCCCGLCRLLSDRHCLSAVCKRYRSLFPAASCKQVLTLACTSDGNGESAAKLAGATDPELEEARELCQYILMVALLPLAGHGSLGNRFRSNHHELRV